jgi:hypothetical protein
VNGLFRSLTAIVAAGALSACGGGGAPTSAVPAPLAQTGAGNNASQNRTPIGTAKLTIVRSSHFHTATGVAKKSQAGTRAPAYVNTNNANTNNLDVWVISNNIATHVVDSSGGGSNLQLSVDGTQTFSIPIFSTSASSIVAYETDQPYGNFGNLLAVGEFDNPQYVAGTPLNISLTMLMNATDIGYMNDPDNLTLSATTSPSFNLGCAYTSPPLYFFEVDANAGFFDFNTAGVGGVSSPTVVSSVSHNSSPVNTLAKGTGVNGAYTVNLPNNSGGLIVNLTVPNPAYLIAYDTNNGGTQYPGVAFLNSTGASTYFGNYISGVYGAGPTVFKSIDFVDNGC